MTAVDWSRYRACTVCFAKLAQPCSRLTGWADGEPVFDEAPEPHGSRKLRAGFTRTGGN